MRNKRVILILLTVIVLAAALITVNRDLFKFTYDLRLERTFTPETDTHRDYLLTDPVPLKPGAYMLTPAVTVNGSGSSVILTGGDDKVLFAAELEDGSIDPSFAFEISGQARQVRFGISYDPATDSLDLRRVKITAEHILYRESLLRHAAISFLLILLAGWFILRTCFSSVLWKILPLFKKPENEAALVFLLVLTAAACYPLFDLKTYVRGEDMFFHLTRIKGLAESLRAGYFPVRDQLFWLRNYGYGTGFYYPDVFLYFPAIMLLLGFKIHTAYKVFLTACTFASILSIWFAALRITGKRTAAASAAIFMAFAAYRLSNLYYRGTVGETQAAVFLPLIVLGLYEIFYKDPKHWKWFAAGFLGLLSCHIISLTMAGVLTFIFLLTHIKKILSDRRIITVLLKSVLLVLAAGAFFWIPMIEQTLTNPGLRVNSLLAGDALLNKTNYAFPVQNLLSRFKRWNYAFQADCIYPGWSLLLVPLLRAALLKRRDKAVLTADFMLAFSVILVWMCTRAFPWTWQVFLPFVTRIQFAYRLLLPATVLLCLCGGIYTSALAGEKRLPLMVLALFCFFSTAFPVLRESVTHRSVDKSLFVMQDNRVSGAEYLPAGMDNEFPYRNGDTVFLSDGGNGAVITSHDRSRLTFRFTYELPEDSGEVRFSVPLIWYTGFRCVLTAADGTILHPEVRPDERGLVSIGNEGLSRGTVFVSYEKTAAQRISECVTLLTLICCFVYAFHRKKTYSRKIRTDAA